MSDNNVKDACIVCWKICDVKDMKIGYSVHVNGLTWYCKDCYNKYIVGE